MGIIEGITEFLPISSTGHLLIAEQWLPKQSDLFNVVIQSAAVLAILPLFPNRCKQLLFGWADASARTYILKIGLAFFITGVGGVILEKSNFQLPHKVIPIASALVVGGVLFLLAEGIKKGTPNDEITWLIAVVVGIGQLIAAVFPGASRSGSTIIMMLLLGVSRTAATEFSFLVGIPTMVAAGGIKIFKEIHRNGFGGENWAMVGLGVLVSAVVSFVVVKWLLGYVRSHTFNLFGWYRIALGIILIFLFWGHY